MRRKVRNRKNDFKTFMDLNFSLALVFNYFERDFYSSRIIKLLIKVVKILNKYKKKEKNRKMVK